MKTVAAKLIQKADRSDLFMAAIALAFFTACLIVL